MHWEDAQQVLHFRTEVSVRGSGAAALLAEGGPSRQQTPWSPCQGVSRGRMSCWLVKRDSPWKWTGGWERLAGSPGEDSTLRGDRELLLGPEGEDTGSKQLGANLSNRKFVIGKW